jgi:hypothetical protein
VSTIQLDSADVRSACERLLSDTLILFPVRHHSPACAIHVAQVIAASRPCAVLIEGPRSFSPLIPLLAQSETQAPVAIYTYAALRKETQGADDRRAAYYPFCDYSPELVAIREAARQGIPTRFIDLDFSEQVLCNPAEMDEEQSSLLDERHYRRSRYLQALAERQGCRDHEDLWEHLFELGAETMPSQQFIKQVAAYCLLSRQDATQDELEADGTLHREAEMAHHIATALQERRHDAGPVLVVLGGYHAVVMPELLVKRQARPSVSKSAVTDEAAALIRYSFDRLDRLNGYSAGMTAPAWHQALWQRMQRSLGANRSADVASRMRRDAALEMLFTVAAELRDKHKLPLPLPALTAAYEGALRLASLRGRAAPLRTDVLDAITSCFIKGDTDGDGRLILDVARRTLCGSTLGRVPPGAGTPPLVRDFAFRARRQRLKIDDSEPRRCVLDIYRRPDHRLTSRLLHGLVLLGVPFASRSAGPDFIHALGLDRLQEHWEYQNSPITEGALVEASMYGVTVPLAVANRFAAQLEQLEKDGKARDAATASASVVQACVLGLHDHLPRTLATLRLAIGEDGTFEGVARAARTLGLLWESREPLEARDIHDLPPLLQAAYERATYLMRELRGQTPDGAVDCVTHLKGLRELLSSGAGRHLDVALYWGALETLHIASDSAVLRGACAGLLYTAGRLSHDALSTELNGHLSGLSKPREAVAYLRGLTQTAREVTWQQPTLLEVLDRLLGGWSEEDFVGALPELRLAFAEMTPRETDRIAEAVAQLHGGRSLGNLVSTDVGEAEVIANLALSRQLATLLSADGLDEFVTQEPR